MNEIKKELKADKTIELFAELDSRIERLERITMGIIKDIKGINNMINRGYTDAMRNVIPLIENIEEELRKK